MTSTLSPILKFLSRCVVLWVGTIFFFAGSIVAWSAAQDWRGALRFEREAVSVPAAVVTTSFEPASRDGNPSTRYLVTYRFDTPDGAVIEQTEAIDVDDWEGLDEGSLLEVRYLRSDPSSAQSQPARSRWLPPLVVGVTTLVALLGVLLARPGLLRMLVIWRVQRSGVEAEATVTEVARTRTVVNRVPQWRLRYEFRDREGRVQEGRSDLLGPAEAAQWRHGDQVTIRFDPGRPRDSYWFGRA